MARAKKAPWPSVIVDTREQRPWTFDGDICRTFKVSITTTRGTLDTGDYALADAPELARIERKSLGDFVGSVTHEHDRFMREVERLAAFPVAIVMVEGELGEVVSRTRLASLGGVASGVDSSARLGEARRPAPVAGSAGGAHVSALR